MPWGAGPRHISHRMTGFLVFVLFFVCLFQWEWVLNSGLLTYKAVSLLLEPHLQSIFLLWLFWRRGVVLKNYLHGLELPSSWCQTPKQLGLQAWVTHRYLAHVFVYKAKSSPETEWNRSRLTIQISVDRRLAAPGDWPEMQVLRPCYRLTESDTLWLRPQVFHFNCSLSSERPQLKTDHLGTKPSHHQGLTVESALLFLQFHDKNSCF
jgi:hypothetical protein